ncbi:hypothetical protein C1J02_05315 [Sulfitobacter sp. SK011]|nr:hypothetical protein C1J02_05315 [Sulfitobacter sp. SK011]
MTKVGCVRDLILDRLILAAMCMNGRSLRCIAKRKTARLQQFLCCEHMQRENQIHRVGSVRTNALAEKQGSNNFG